MDQTWLTLKVRALAMLTAIILAWSISTESNRQSHIGKFAVSLEEDVKRFKHRQRASILIHHNYPRVFIGS